MGKTTLAVLAGIILVIAGLLVYWIRQPPQDCSFSGWKRTVGVELEAQVNNLDIVKSKIGITDAQVRDYDTLLKHYALKYDAACQDVRAKRMTQSEYSCLRRNMDNTLDQIQRFIQAVDAAKTVTDATSQRQAILQLLDDLRGSSNAGYRSGCTSAMDVNPTKLSFMGNIPERSVQISNAGNSDFTYSITGLPESFDPKPNTGSVARGTTVTVSILRTILPTPPKPIRFHIHTNLQDDAEVEISVDSQNASLWQNLGEQAQKSADDKSAPVTVQDAAEVVGKALGVQSKVPEAERLLLASNVLFEIHAESEAKNALAMASSRDPHIAQRPTSLILAGLIANRQNQKDEALKFFSQAGNTAASTDVITKNLSNLFSGSLAYAKGDRREAASVLQNPGIQTALGKNPSLAKFTAAEFCPPPRTCTASLPTVLGVR